MARRGEGRGLTAGELSALSAGLGEALSAAGVRPRIVPHAHWLAYLARLWRGSLPVMVLGRTIYWPGVAKDVSLAGYERQMAVLQHELQHVLDFATGALTLASYVLWPPNWIYGYRLNGRLSWQGLGAEQRAQMAQDYWLAERGLMANAPLAEDLRRIIPWAVDKADNP